MKSVRLIGLALLLLPGLLAAQNHQNKKHSVSAIFNNAKYVWVESEGGDADTPGLQAEDRRAIGDVMQGLHDWKRYSLTASRKEADLIFVVRKGRLASVRLGGSAGNGGMDPMGGTSKPGQQRPGGIGAGVGAGAEAGPPDDTLEVYTVKDGSRGTKVWQRAFPNGLNAPEVLLLLQLKKAVEKEYPMSASGSQPGTGAQPNSAPRLQPGTEQDKP